jgi:hypothetical protein
MNRAASFIGGMVARSRLTTRSVSGATYAGGAQTVLNHSASSRLSERSLRLNDLFNGLLRLSL